MNINSAKQYIKDTVSLYLKKDEFGEYRIPVQRQRPIFMIGAPGIGKTAIMEQIAQELSVGLVAYSMTHHTRQSALGLPYIKHQEYDGQQVDVTEYTMSEIISSIYDVMENSGIKEGILFLDEINCVSETLAPSMLQFLQYKVFGKHSVPEGWVIVTAGNPPQYNKSVREFDIVTLDRLKVLDVEADYQTFKAYAGMNQIHSAILTYLELKPEHFYYMETTVNGKNYVTARGWEDLSQILQLYEESNLPVEEDLVSQYLRSDKIVKEFTAYYDLYQKYKQDYKVEDILSGNPTEGAISKANNAPFDERLSLLGMLLDKIQLEMKEVMQQADYLSVLKPMLQACMKLASKEEMEAYITKQITAKQNYMKSMSAAQALSGDMKYQTKSVIAFLDMALKKIAVQEDCIAALRTLFTDKVGNMQNRTKEVSERLHNLFEFVESAFKGGNEMLIFVTELTVNTESAKFIATFGSEDYRKYNDELMITERQNKYLQEIEALDL
ncbi:MAG: AAA family ATPase [Lachnospiraceae bacterium]|nr:AAA family ATPase [Lachnospiraceae bacterium]